MVSAVLLFSHIPTHSTYAVLMDYCDTNGHWSLVAGHWSLVNGQRSLVTGRETGAGRWKRRGLVSGGQCSPASVNPRVTRRDHCLSTEIISAEMAPKDSV